MKRSLLVTMLSAFIYLSAFSQADTAFRYFLKTGRETTKDSAYSYIKLYKQNGAWHGREYYVKNNVLKSEGNYAAGNTETPLGSFNNYSEDGKITFMAEYSAGKLSEKTFYYKSGNKKSWISYSDKGAHKQKGWDETGKEIKNFVVEREATFKGGMEGWRKYLEKHLDANVPADAGLPAGNYEVKLQFVINKEGSVSNVKAVAIPAKCKACGSEAVRAISEGPDWVPAIQNNEPVIYQAIQYITFQVIEEKKKGKS